MPITREVYAMLYEDKPPLEAVVDLMTRPMRAERE
jgi:glycerol-3-phosphate dehydrogenase